ncbi:hypothetical protein PPL_07993 [Heterostelium album PN500]|uniref:Uncharacterized protein n=1 Tax=Heterostelium pallidum (strain ATCC 26659 / Pp 5 / PN500) TaxID=670386 RepID=D3BHJ1_HETP5|nr:hypothetical protein PPL_07993 [Heterostelium album PN500]EFA79168.1 hypothetical protein PPL_07993 [Heterostelium album PN500]|eukprot:XP_020431289.1 hypothetical protein PPL_07993 [Heterostelium album PN500]
MISHTDITFQLEFPVGRKYVAAQFHLRKGEDTSVAVAQFMQEFDIPPYLSVSLLNTIDTFLDDQYIRYNDDQDKLNSMQRKKDDHINNNAKQ